MKNKRKQFVTIKRYLFLIFFMPKRLIDLVFRLGFFTTKQTTYYHANP